MDFDIDSDASGADHLELKKELDKLGPKRQKETSVLLLKK